jgi:hypothetical protein
MKKWRHWHSISVLQMKKVVFSGLLQLDRGVDE